MHHHSHHWLVVRELPANFSLLKMTTASLWERLTEEEHTVATTRRNIGCKENDEMRVALPRAASVLIGLDGWMCDTDTYLASERSLKTLCSVQVFMYFFYNKPSFRETVGIWIVSVREAFKTNFR